MNTKKILVSFLLIASLVFLAGIASALPIDAGNLNIDINDVEVVTANVVGASVVSAVAEDTITVKVEFTVDDLDVDPLSMGSASNVRIKAELEGDTTDTTAVSSLFDIEGGMTYVKTLTIKVPADFESDALNAVFNLNLKIWNSDHETSVNGIVLNVQRASYEVAIKSVMTGKANAGDSLAVDVVLKNIGYNDADDVYITVGIPELNIQKSSYFGNLVDVLEEETSSDNDDSSTLSGKLNLDLPYTAKPGVYSLVVEVEADGVTSTVTKELTIDNTVPDIAMKSGNELVLLNPTGKLVVYTVKYNLNEVTVVVPAGSSKSVSIDSVSENDFDVLVYSGETLLSTVKYSGNESKLSSPVFVLTIVLAIVFLVLLVVLVVLITKKPQKAEEFGESYY